ncbi:unnamed protein product [Boreogadus saida]
MSRKKLAWANKEVETFVCILGEEDVVYDVYVAAAAIDIRPTTKAKFRSRQEGSLVVISRKSVPDQSAFISRMLACMANNGPNSKFRCRQEGSLVVISRKSVPDQSAFISRMLACMANNGPNFEQVPLLYWDVRLQFNGASHCTGMCVSSSTGLPAVLGCASPVERGFPLYWDVRLQFNRAPRCTGMCVSSGTGLPAVLGCASPVQQGGPLYWDVRVQLNGASCCTGMCVSRSTGLPAVLEIVVEIID